MSAKSIPASTANPAIQMRPVAALRPHPKNSEIYGDVIDEALVESIRVNGVLQPLVVTADSGVIVGHRRLTACLAAGVTEVPVIVSDRTDEWDILELLLDSNRQRVKTNEQLGREAQWCFKVEQEKARRRQATARTGTHGGSLPAVSPEGSGDARDVTARKLGIGAKKMEEAVAVVGAIDALKGAGKSEAADALREVLNNESVHRAHATAKDAGYLGEPRDLKNAVKRTKETNTVWGAQGGLNLDSIALEEADATPPPPEVSAAPVFVLADGGHVEAGEWRPGILGTEWLEARLRAWELRDDSMTSAQSSWIADKQRTLVKLAADINAVAGAQTSLEAVHGVAEALRVLTIEIDRQTESRRPSAPSARTI